MTAIKIFPGKVVHISDEDEVWFNPKEWVLKDPQVKELLFSEEAIHFYNCVN